MRLAKNALLIALTMLTLIFAVSAQTLRSPNDDRNTAPTVGTGGPVGGATGLFTIYDGQTLRKGEFTFSAAYSNFDRDPGNADVTQVPVSFQIGLNDNLELFFETDAYKGVKINSPGNLSSFYLPNSQFRVGSGFQSGGAIILAPGTSGPNFNQAIFRPAGTAPFVQFPYTGGSLGNLGSGSGVGSLFGFAAGSTPTLGPPRAGGASSNFPGVGSIYGSILPGIVFATTTVTFQNTTEVVPLVYTAAPAYLPDAPFINRTYGQTAFNTFTAGGKWRLNSAKSAWGLAVVPFYRWNADSASTASGFNQLQRGASAGGSRGDFGATLVADSRIRKWLNVAANIGYVYTTRVKDGSTVLLDRPDELQYGVGVDMPVNKYFQIIGEGRQTRYVGGRTPNVFENDPVDLIGGVRIFPYRWMSIGAAYRYHLNQQDRDYFEKINFSSNARFLTCTGIVGALTCTSNAAPTSSGNLANFVSPSSDPHGFIFQLTAGRRNARGAAEVENKFANVDSLDLDNATVMLPCAPGTRSKSGKCSDNVSTGVKTKATDPENDVLTYNYTVSGGRIVGQGANVNWDLSGVKPGTYTITAAVDDGCGFCGKTQTKTITVAECDDCEKVCECANLSVTGPSGSVEPGQTATFTANLQGGTQDNITYNWTATCNIVEGQGTPVIRVAGEPNTSCTATVTIAGVCEGCPTTASESASFAGKPTSEKVDEFNNLTPDEIKARLDIINNRISSDPTSKAVIINYGSAAAVRKREADLRKAIAFRGFDASRYTFVNGGPTTDGSKVKTEFWYVPAGAPDPTPGM